MTKESGFDFQQGQEIFLFSSVQTGCGVHLSLCSVRNGGVAMGVNQPGCEFDHPSRSSVEINLYLLAFKSQCSC
jgi:hypothetical protein